MSGGADGLPCAMVWNNFSFACRRVPLAMLFLWTVSVLPGAAGAQSVQLITAEGQRQMLSHPGTEVAGPFSADVTVVEFFDYNCPFCKKQVPALKALLAGDPKIAVIYKEWPI